MINLQLNNFVMLLLGADGQYPEESHEKQAKQHTVCQEYSATAEEKVPPSGPSKP